MPDANLYLQVKVVTPKQTLFEGKAASITSKNSAGNFDILPYHANFITIVENQPITIRKEDKVVVKFEFSEAIIYVSKDIVTIYAEPNLARS